MSAGVWTLPEVSLRLGDRVLPGNALDSLVGVRIRRELGSPAQCELVLQPSSGSEDWSRHLLPGVGFALLLPECPEPLFAGDVTAVEHDYGPGTRHCLRVRGYDKLHRLRRRNAPRAHVRVTAEDLARDLSADLGVRTWSAHRGPRFSRIIQHQDTDLELLVDVARRAGLWPVLNGDLLRLENLAGRGEPLPLKWSAGLLEARFELNADSACRTITAYAEDALAGGDPSSTAREPRVGPTAREAVASWGGACGELHRTNAPIGGDSALSSAQQELDWRVAGAATLRGQCRGNPQLLPGRVVSLTDVAPSVAGRYVLTAVTHQLDAERGFVTELSTQPPPPVPRPEHCVTTVGVVTDVGDPEELGRLRTRLPAYGDVETDWMRIAFPGAAASKGLVALSDVGDHVLVLFHARDPAHGVVLGGVFTGSGPQDAGVEDDAVQRFSFATAEGQRVTLDRGQHSASLDNGQGSRIVLRRNEVRLQADGDLILEAPGRRLLLRAATIDLEKA